MVPPLGLLLALLPQSQSLRVEVCLIPNQPSIRGCELRLAPATELDLPWSAERLNALFELEPVAVTDDRGVAQGVRCERGSWLLAGNRQAWDLQPITRRDLERGSMGLSPETPVPLALKAQTRSGRPLAEIPIAVQSPSHRPRFSTRTDATGRATVLLPPTWRNEARPLELQVLGLGYDSVTHVDSSVFVQQLTLEPPAELELLFEPDSRLAESLLPDLRLYGDSLEPGRKPSSAGLIRIAPVRPGVVLDLLWTSPDHELFTENQVLQIAALGSEELRSLVLPFRARPRLTFGAVGEAGESREPAQLSIQHGPPPAEFDDPSACSFGPPYLQTRASRSESLADGVGRITLPIAFDWTDRDGPSVLTVVEDAADSAQRGLHVLLQHPLVAPLTDLGDLQLNEPQLLAAGRVLDHAGRPVRNFPVQLRGVLPPEGRPSEAAGPPGLSHTFLLPARKDKAAATRTDHAGRFEIRGYPLLDSFYVVCGLNRNPRLSQLERRRMIVIADVLTGTDDLVVVRPQLD